MGSGASEAKRHQRKTLIVAGLSGISDRFSESIS
jgi:hypothetical protein